MIYNHETHFFFYPIRDILDHKTIYIFKNFERRSKNTSTETFKNFPSSFQISMPCAWPVMWPLTASHGRMSQNSKEFGGGDDDVKRISVIWAHNKDNFLRSALIKRNWVVYFLGEKIFSKRKKNISCDQNLYYVWWPHWLYYHLSVILLQKRLWNTKNASEEN